MSAVSRLIALMSSAVLGRRSVTLGAVVLSVSGMLALLVLIMRGHTNCQVLVVMMAGMPAVLVGVAISLGEIRAITN